MKRKFFRAGQVSGLLILVLFLAVISCNKEPEGVGLEIQPEADKMNLFVTDTFSIRAYARKNDSVRTDNTSLSLLGSYMDPVFGKSQAGFYTQMLLSNNEADFGFTPVLDSMMLYLAYNGYYGDIKTPVTIRIFEVTEELFYDTVYYSHRDKEIDPVEIASFTFVPKPHDSVYFDTIQYPPQMVLNISEQNPSFAEKILNADELSLSDNEEYVKFIKGLYITADPVDYGGSILYMNLLSSLSKLTLHYSNVNYDSVKYDFLLNENCARYNRFDHFNYEDASPILQQQVVYDDTALGDQILYVQAMQGINTNLWLPHIESFGSDKAIYKAELFIDDLRPGRKYSAPPKLLLGIMNDDGTFTQLIDELEGETYFGGVYDSTHYDYRFRISRHIQRILTGRQENVGLSLIVAGRSVRSERVMLGGPMHPLSPMRLEITYSSLILDD